MALTKQNLAESIHRQVALLKYQSTHLVKALLEIIKRTLESGEDVLISGFGKFWLKDKEARKGRNHETGENLILRARRVVRFRCSQGLAEKINEKGDIAMTHFCCNIYP
jgi:integration host factor subunit alpha